MPRTKKEVEQTEKVKKATSTVKKATAKKSSNSSKKTTTKKKSDDKVLAVKKTSTKKKTTPKSKKSTTTTTAKKTTTKKVTTKKTSKNKDEFINILEYYDLPYRYNETIVKILAQTPKILFVYWDISDNDRAKYVEKYGEYFFNDTYPVLVVHNKTLNYSKEIEINDFANSWYISIPDSRSEYTVELGRRFKEYAKRNPEIKSTDNIHDMLSITHSNNLIMPNDHILLEEIKPQVKYRNVKTNEESYKSVYHILADNKLVDFYNLYKNIYQVQDLSNVINLNNPSSGNPTSTFK